MAANVDNIIEKSGLVRAYDFATPALEDYSGMSKEEVRKVLHKLLDDIPDEQLVNFRGAHISVIV